MTGEDEFEPRLGKLRARGSRRGRRYLHQVLRAAARAGQANVGGSASTRAGRGRGAGVSRVLGSRDRLAFHRQRRVVIKSRIARLAGGGAAAARAHLRYIKRDGVTRDGDRGALYGAGTDRADGAAFLDRSEGDRHQFRFIVSAEDGAQYDELKPLTRRLMAQVEEDLGTRLDWVAVDHFNTGHPHTHILVRGRDDRGSDLVIARDYIASGMRERAAEIVQLDLGPRTDLEIQERLRAEVEQERFTSLDRMLVRSSDPAGRVAPDGRDPFRQSLQQGRLRKLDRLGLADELEPGRWRIADDLEPMLRRIGERGDIIKTLHRELSARALVRGPLDQAIFDPSLAGDRPLVGRLVARGLADELNDRLFLILDGLDGRSHYVDVGTGGDLAPLPEGAIVRVTAKPTGPRTVDRTVAEIAAAHGGRYDVDLHLRHDASATAEFARAHVRRLEAMRRLVGEPERLPDGTWVIAPDHVEKAAAFEARQGRSRPVSVEILSALPLEQQVEAQGATWLDRDLVSGASEPLRDGGLGREVREARARRLQWLLAEQLARLEGDQVRYRPDLETILQRRDLARAAAQLSDETGLSFFELRPGERVEGTYRRHLDLASGRFAMVEAGRNFTLVPWRPVLERHLGANVSGVMRGGGVSWSIGRSRGGPAIE